MDDLDVTVSEDEAFQDQNTDVIEILSSSSNADEESDDSAYTEEQAVEERKPKAPAPPTDVVTPKSDGDTAMDNSSAAECSICCDVLTSNGPHRVVSLSCGHVYGKGCIERWVKERRTCPQCSTKVKKNDIRPLYLNSLSVVDDSLQKELEKKYQDQKHERIRLREECYQMTLNYQTLRQKYQKQTQQLDQTMSDLYVLQKAHAATSAAAAPSTQEDQLETKNWTYLSMGNISTCESRVVRFLHSAEVVLIGRKFGSSSNDHGFAKMNIHHQGHSQSIPGLHRQAIRDMAIHPTKSNTLVLSTAFDKKLVVSNLQSDMSVMKFNMDRPGWSCEWDLTREHVMYCGTSGGLVVVYDMRQTKGPLGYRQTHVSTSTSENGRHLREYKNICQPVHALCHIGSSTACHFLSGTFSSLSCWNNQFPDTENSNTNNDDAHPATLMLAEMKNQSQSFVSNHQSCGSIAKDQCTPNRFVISSKGGQPGKHVVVDYNSESNVFTQVDAPMTNYTNSSGFSHAATWTIPAHVTRTTAPLTIVASANELEQHKGGSFSIWSTFSDPGESVARLEREKQHQRHFFGSMNSSCASPSESIIDIQHVVPFQEWKENSAPILGCLTKSSLRLYKFTHKQQ